MNESDLALIRINKEYTLEGKIVVASRSIELGKADDYLLVYLGDLYCQRAASYIGKIKPVSGTVPKEYSSEKEQTREQLREVLNYFEKIKKIVKSKEEAVAVRKYLSNLNLQLGLLSEDDEDKIRYFSGSEDKASLEWMTLLFAKKGNWERAGTTAAKQVLTSESHSYYYATLARAIVQNEQALNLKSSEKQRALQELIRVFESVSDNSGGTGEQNPSRLNWIHMVRIYDSYLGMARITEPVLELGMHMLSKLREMIEEQHIRNHNPNAHMDLIQKVEKEIVGGYIKLAEQAEDKLPLLEKASEIDPEGNVLLYFLMAKVYRANNRNEEAISCYKRILKIYSKAPLANLYVGGSSFISGDYRAAGLYLRIFFNSELFKTNKERLVPQTAISYSAYLYSCYKTEQTKEPIALEVVDDNYKTIPVCDLMIKLIVGKQKGIGLSSKRARKKYFGFDPLDLDLDNIVVGKIKEELGYKSNKK